MKQSQAYRVYGFYPKPNDARYTQLLAGFADMPYITQILPWFLRSFHERATEIEHHCRYPEGDGHFKVCTSKSRHQRCELTRSLPLSEDETPTRMPLRGASLAVSCGKREPLHHRSRWTIEARPVTKSRTAASGRVKSDGVTHLERDSLLK